MWIQCDSDIKVLGLHNLCRDKDNGRLRMARLLSKNTVRPLEYIAVVDFSPISAVNVEFEGLF